MKTSASLRLSLLIAALGAALSAHAGVTLGLVSSGVFDNTNDPDHDAFIETVLLQQGGFGSLTSLEIDLVNQYGFPLSATGFYTGTGGTLDFDVTYTSDSNAADNYQGVTGTWTATSGTGSYLGATGSGTITTNIDYSLPTTLNPSFTTFRGIVQTVPEPASFAVLGLGAAATFRRRKRA